MFKYGVRDFKGLAIEKLWNDKTYDVVHLDFSGLKCFKDREAFRRSLISVLLSNFSPLGFEYPVNSSLDFMGQLKLWLKTRANASLVLLIDEYDTPLTAQLDDTDAFEAIVEVLGEFYSVISDSEAQLRFFFMIGITKLRHDSSFLAISDLKDISTDAQYGSLLGFDEKEIHTCFSSYLQRAAEILGLVPDKLLLQLRAEYGGYCFELGATTRVFAPWSVLNFLDDPQSGFINYRYESGGQPTVLKNI